MNVMTLPEIMDKSIDILRKYLKSIIMFSVGYVILAFIILIPVFIVMSIIIAITAFGSSSPTVTFIMVSLLAIPIFFGFMLSHSIGLIKIASQDILKEKVLAFDAIKASFKSFFKCIGIGAAGTVLSLPLLAVLGGLVYVIYVTVDVSGFLYNPYIAILGSDSYAVLIIILFMLFILVLALVITMYLNFFTFSLQALTLEKQGVIGSITRSFKMVKGSFWRIFGCSILFYSTVYLISYSLQSFLVLIGGLVYLLLQFLNIPQDAISLITIVYNYSSYPVSILSALVISPLWVIMMTYLYYNQKFIREGYDMSLKLKEIRENNLKDPAVKINRESENLQ